MIADIVRTTVNEWLKDKDGYFEVSITEEFHCVAENGTAFLRMDKDSIHIGMHPYLERMDIVLDEFVVWIKAMLDEEYKRLLIEKLAGIDE